MSYSTAVPTFCCKCGVAIKGVSYQLGRDYAGNILWQCDRCYQPTPSYVVPPIGTLTAADVRRIVREELERFGYNCRVDAP